MNSLSWLIYLASVAGSIGGIAVFVMIAAILCFLASGFVYLNADDYDDDYRGRDDAKRRTWASRMMKQCVGAFVLASVIIIVVPGRDTVYAIAASEMGEELLNSDTGSKAVQALDLWLDRQIAGDKGE